MKINSKKEAVVFPAESAQQYFIEWLTISLSDERSEVSVICNCGDNRIEKSTASMLQKNENEDDHVQAGDKTHGTSRRRH